MSNNGNEEYGKVNRFFGSPIVVAIITILAAVLGGLAGAMYESKTSENEIVRKLSEELEFINENKGLASAIDDIKNELESKKSELEEANNKITELNYKLSETDSLRSQIETERLEKEHLKDNLAEYKFSTPDLSIDGNTASIDDGDFLSYKGKIYFGSSIMKHFFADGSIQYGENTLNISTEGGIVPVIPQLENGIDLLSMETTHVDGYIGTAATKDNFGINHSQAVYTTGDGIRYIEFRLDDNYRYFKCTAFVTKKATNFSYDSDIWDKASISITADNGIHLWDTKAISRDSAQQDSPVIDISGMKYIRITFSNAGAWSDRAILSIGEPRLFLE